MHISIYEYTHMYIYIYTTCKARDVYWSMLVVET